ncbi:MAG: cystathionine beta-synthase [Ardenticatenales bacterium]
MDSSMLPPAVDRPAVDRPAADRPAADLPGVAASVLDTIGGTPLVRLGRVTDGAAPDVLAKVEFFNPGGSVKDRIGLAMIEAAERDGRLKPGGTIVECTSGNTGVGLAIAAALKGYQAIFTMPDKMSDEKIRVLRAFGARVVVTPTAVEPDDPRSYYAVARRLAAETPGAVLVDQYSNPANPAAHYASTGPEIWEQTGGRITHFICTIGTGGTITGTGRYLKERNPDIQIVGVDPVGSILHDYFYTGVTTPAHSYAVEGIGEDFIPSVYDFGVIDDIVQVTDGESFRMARRLVREEGLFVGGSCGSAVAGALAYIRDRGVGPDAVVVVLLPDSGSRYLSKLFNDDWLRENGFHMGERIRGHVTDVLTRRGPSPAVTISPDCTIASAVDLMQRHGISQLPVVDDAGDIVGVLGERDVLAAMFDPGRADDAAARTVAALVSNRIAVVEPGTTLAVLGRIFADTDLVVVRGGDQLLGVLTKIDLIAFLTDSAGNDDEPPSIGAHA